MASLAPTAPDGVRRPVAELSIGSESAERWAEHLLSCEVHCALMPHVDRVQVLIASAGPRPSLGDSAQVSLGYEDASTDAVFAGEVQRVRDELNGTRRITLCNGARQLAAQRINASYEQQSAGDIVTALANAASVSLGTIDSGIDFPFLAIDDRRTLLDHIEILARCSGLLAYFDESNALHFCATSQATPVQSFRYGVDVLGLMLSEVGASIDSVSVIGEGAAGSEGQDASSWLLADPASVTSTSGQGSVSRTLTDPSLRSAQATQTAADAVIARAALACLTGELWTTGAPAVRAGSPIEITDAPQSALNGRALVRAVLHRFDKRRGFTTRLHFAQDGGGSGLGGLP